MTRKPPKTAVVAFKVEEELAEFLNKLPNKSAFIRKAIAAQLGMACPLCNGKGVVPRGVHDHYAGLMSQLNLSHCEGCGNELPLPHPDSATLREMSNEVVTWVVQHFATLPEQPIGRTAGRAETERLLREPPPEQGSDFLQVLEEFQQKIAPYAFRINHPRFLAFI